MKKKDNEYHISWLDMIEVESYINLHGFLSKEDLIYDKNDNFPCGVFSEQGIVARLGSRLEEELDRFICLRVIE